MPKHKIAVITRGGIAGGLFNQGIPALLDLFNTVSDRYDLRVFQAETLTPEELSSRRYRISTFQPRIGSPRLIARMTADHLRSRYDLIHGLWLDGAIHGLRVGRLLRLPVVMSLLGGEVACIPEIGYGALRSQRGSRRLIRACARAAAITTGSQFQRTKLAHVFHGDAHIVYLGVDTELFAFAPPPLLPPYELIHVANLTEVKDQGTLLKAFDLIRSRLECRLNIVGPDYMDGQLQSLVAKLGLENHVIFAGPVPHTELPRYYERAHMLLHSSLYEAQAVAPLEAMASGVAVVGTAVGMLADLNGRCCVTTAPGDHEALARAALELLTDHDRLKAMRLSARRWATEHTAQWTADRFMELYESVISQPSTL